jgi:hypothetical protein
MAVNEVKATKRSKSERKKARVKNPEKLRRSGLKWNAVAVVALLSVMAVQMVWMAWVKSATMDEQNHITRGATYLRTGDMRLMLIHPPLINIISALLIAWDESIVLPLDHPSWHNANLNSFATEFLWEANHDSHSIVFKARLPIVALALLLALIAWAWARELYGDKAALLTLALVALSPNITAHGSLATNDVGFACFALLSAYTFWRWLKVRTPSRALIAGIALGLAMASKFSAVFLIPALAITALAHFLTDPSEERTLKRFARLFALMVCIAVLAAMAVWLVYGFDFGYLRGKDIAVPASSYYNQMQHAARRVEQGNPTFLLGSYSETGWWYYFPFTFVVKTPLPTLALIVISFVYCWRRRAWRPSLPLLVPPAIYMIISMIMPLNIGYRHIIPAVVFLLIFAGQVAQNFKQSRWFARAVAVALVWLVIEVASTFPDNFAYFNQIAGGPDNGYRVLGDSNLDWGQDLIQLREYMEREGIESVKLSYFGSADPEAYGVQYEPLPSYPRYIWNHNYVPLPLQQPAPGVYAISATNLQGTLFKNHDLYEWFRSKKPDAVIGHSIFIYRLKA